MSKCCVDNLQVLQPSDATVLLLLQPDWVRDAQETLNYRRNNVFLTKDEIEHHADQVKKYNRIMDVKKPIKKSAKALIRLASGLGHKGKVSSQ